MHFELDRKNSKCFQETVDAQQEGWIKSVAGDGRHMVVYREKKQIGVASHDIIIRPSYIPNIPVEGSLLYRVMCLNVMFLLKWRELLGMMRHLVTSHHVQ